MSIWLDLFFRELVLLALLGAAGSGVVALLARPLSAASRIALAPSVGLALVGAVLTTAHLAVPMRIGAWALLVPMIVASVAVALVSRRRDSSEVRRRPSGRELLQLTTLVVVALALLNVPLAARHSLGPMGYSVFDANSYVGFEQAARDHTLRQDISHLQSDPDLTYRAWAFYSKSFVLIRVDSFAAATGEILGWRSSDTQAPFMAMLLVVGCLGVFSLARELTGTRSWFPVLGGLLFAGPVFFQLYIDGSQGLISGLALVPAALLALALYVRASRRARWTAILLLGLLAAGLDTMHPVFMVLLTVWGLSFAAAVVVADVVRRRRVELALVARALLPLLAVGVLAAALSPVATVFNFRFYDWARSNFYTQGLPQYSLPVQVLPAWLLQTREFFFLPRGVTSLDGLVRNLLMPLALAAAAVFGVWRYRRAWLLLALVPGIVVFGLFAMRQDCSYCVQRNLIPIAPALVALVTVGLIALWHAPHRRLRPAAVVLGLAIVGLAGHKSVVEARRLIQGGYAVPAEVRDVLRKLPQDGPVYLEAFGEGRNGPAAMEMPALYNVVNEATSQRLALSIETNDYGGLAYLIGQRAPATQYGPEYTPDFRWVVTRVADIKTARRVISREGPFAVEERARPFDVSITSGIGVDEIDRDRRGEAWVEAPMTFWTAAETPEPASLRLTFSLMPGVRIGALPEGAKRLPGGAEEISLCVPVQGTEALRRTTVALQFTQAQERPAPDVFGNPSPAKAVRISAMRAVAGGCA